jgi:hypothetical protein
MSELRARQRKSMPKSAFAYVDASGEGHLPLNDESHVRNAIARWNQTGFPSRAAKERARRNIIAAARRHGIEISVDDRIRRPTTGLRPARTRRGPRGGKRTVQPRRSRSA